MSDLADIDIHNIIRVLKIRCEISVTTDNLTLDHKPFTYALVK